MKIGKNKMSAYDVASSIYLALAGGGAGGDGDGAGGG
jgi:hypothetical protein